VKVDAFLPNDEHFEKAEDFLYPLMVHELARYLDQIGEDPVASDNDKNNGAAMLISMAPNVRNLPSHIRRYKEPTSAGTETGNEMNGPDRREVRRIASKSAKIGRKMSPSNP
jgi:hypothetical protein